MTSIEWLEMELLYKMNGTPIVDKLLFDKAKEMHKQEILNTYIIADSESTQEDSEHNAEQYYEETFKK